MGKTQGKGENTKKAAGNAKKAENAARKQAVVEASKEREETQKWDKGAKSTSKKEEADAKKADAARKKAERDALLAEEEVGARSKPKNSNQKTAVKKSRGTLDLSTLDSLDGTSTPSSNLTLNATGIENALDALGLTEGTSDKIDRHPERRYKAAYALFEERRMPEVEKEHPGLRRNQRVEILRKEFEKSPENPFNMTNVAFDASRDEIREMQEKEREGKERVLTK